MDERLLLVSFLIMIGGSSIFYLGYLLGHKQGMKETLNRLDQFPNRVFLRILK